MSAATRGTGEAGGHLPPGPRAPAWWQTVEWIVRPTALLRRCAARYGEPFTLRTLWADAPMVLVSHPEDVRRVFTAEPSVLRGGGSAVLEPFAGPASLLVLDGAEHLRHRRLQLPAFHGDALRAYEPLVAELAARELASWPRGRRVSTHARMQALTLEVMLRVVLGSDAPALRAAIEEALALVRSAPRLVATSVLGRDAAFRRAVERVDALLYALIAERRAAAEPHAAPPPILDRLLAAHDDHGRPPSDAELRDQLVTLLAAGHETTATALAWAFERLARDPRLVADLRSGDGALLDATVREVLRIRPVLSVAPREVVAPLELHDGRTVPPGAQVAACIYLTHRRADAFPPDPLAFRPRRWLDRPKPPPYAYIPFGGGPRRCLGAAFAQMEIREVLRAAVARLDLRAPARGERVRRRAVSLAPAAGGRVVPL
ncbi:MAG TPA: cytochrome P450 [Solirubrobacteraceae bacterium]|jgi:cytochrome P450|nr:cytochrome P450 [Solirubrobacteraceae bacterium]